MENQLLKGEKHFENLEIERKAKLKEEREQALALYEVETDHIQLGEMSIEVWDNYFSGVKLQHENRISAEKKVEADHKAEQERVQQDREVEQRKADRINKASEIGLLWRDSTKTYGFNDINLPEKDLINMEPDEFVKKLEEISIGIKERTKAINETAKKREDERKAKEAEVKKKAIQVEREKAETERKAIEEKARKERAAAEVKAQKETEARKRIEAALQVQKDAMAKREADKQTAIELELSKGDKEKFQSIISDLAELKNKYSFKSKKYQFLQNQVNELIDKILTFTESKLS